MANTGKKYKDNTAVHLELKGRGSEVASLKDTYKCKLTGTEIEVVETGNSASFSLSVRTITPPKYDEPAVRKALEAASFLKSWWEDARLEEHR